MIIVEEETGGKFTTKHIVACEAGKEESVYKRLVDEAADKNRRFISVELDTGNSTTINCDNIVRITRR